MIIICSEDLCTGCGACKQICPKSCISMNINNNGFIIPIINHDRCSECSLCQKICPVLNPNSSSHNVIGSYKAWSSSETVRERSTSGGIFFEIAYEIIKSGGVVFGAVFHTDFNVHHIVTDNINGIREMSGSKYINSDTENTYIEAKQLLDSDKYVLYSGSPCQIAGLKNVLKRNYDNLFTCDFICHGIGSTKVFISYLNYLAKKSNSKPSSVEFRNKAKGYNKSQFVVEFENGERFSSPSYLSCFGYGFASDLITRNCCVSCKYTSINRQADITLADYSGDDLNNEDKTLGVSTILVNTTKGERLINSCGNRLKRDEKQLSEVIKYTYHLTKQSNRNPLRNSFFADLNNIAFEKLMNKYLKPPIGLMFNRLLVIKFMRTFLCAVKTKIKVVFGR